VDLATPTPLTYIDTRTVYNCSVTTTSYNPALPLLTEFQTQWFVATVNGMTYPAENSIPITQIITTTTYITTPITFPGLTVTQLTPGEAITLVPLLICLPLVSVELSLMRRVGLQVSGLHSTDLDTISNYPPAYKWNTYTSVFVPTNATPYSSPTPTAPPTPTAAS
jgi:hypothetical protein